VSESLSNLLQPGEPLFWAAWLSVLVSGILRGFTGFGSALFSVPILSLFLSPALAAPIVMGLQVLSGLESLRKDRPVIDMRSTVQLSLPSVVTSLAGIGLLVSLPESTLRLCMGLIVLGAVAVLASGWRFERRPGPLLTLGVGAVSGLLNGLSAMSGPPLVLYFLGGPFSPATARASMTNIFMVQGGISLFGLLLIGALSWQVLIVTALLYPVLALGTWLGTAMFCRASPKAYRQVAIGTLATLAMVLMLQAAQSLI